MLRLIIDWFANHPEVNHVLSLPEKAKWYSEALLPSPFPPRQRSDKYGESWTHADCVIGHFGIGHRGLSDLFLLPDATRFRVIEAKMFSKLSTGVKHATYYNQAARIIACIAETITRANRKPWELHTLGFYLLAPRAQIEAGAFAKLMLKNSIRTIVERRIKEYGELKNEWFQQWFLPTLETIDIRSLSWEEVLSQIVTVDPLSGTELLNFYEKC